MKGDNFLSEDYQLVDTFGLSIGGEGKVLGNLF
jgi:hypothetical protein